MWYCSFSLLPCCAWSTSPCPLHPAALLPTLDQSINPVWQLCHSQIGVCVCVCVSQATDGSFSALCGMQLSELLKKSNGFEHLVTCASSVHPSLLSDGCTQRLLTWMTAVLSPAQALGSGKDTLIFVLLLFTLQWCSALPGKDQDSFLKVLSKVSENQFWVFFGKRRPINKVELWIEGNNLPACMFPWSQQSFMLFWPLGTS